MNKLLISDALNELQPDLEVGMKMKISKKKIKNITLSQIGSGGKRQQKFKFAVIIPLTAIILVLSVCTVAASYSEGFRIFLYDNLFFLNAREINESDSDSGIKMTVKSAVNDGNSSMILIELAKEDHQEFSGDVDLHGLELSIPAGGLEYQKQVELSTDKKIIYCLLRVISTEQIAGQKLTLTLNGIKTDIMSNQKQIVIDLLSLYNNQPISNGEDDVLIINIQNFNKKISDGISLEGIAYINNDLCIFYDKNNNSNQTSSIPCLLSKTSGEKLYADECYNFISPLSDEKERVCMVFKNSDLDLSDLDILVDHSYAAEIDGKWNINFKLERGDQPIEKSTDINLKIENYTVKISKIKASMLGLQLNGILTDEMNDTMKEFFELDISIVLNNGEIIKPVGNSLQYSSDIFHFNSIIKDPVHISEIHSIIINGMEVVF